MSSPKLWSPAVTVTIMPAWIRPTWTLWVATMIWPRCETRRCTITGPQTARHDGGGSPDPSKAVPLPVRDGTRQGAQERAVVADDGHLGAFHPQRDPADRPTRSRR